MSRKSVVALALMAAVFTSPLIGQSRGKTKEKEKGKPAQPATPSRTAVVASPHATPHAQQPSVLIFHDSDRTAIRRYHRDHPVAVTELPPGIRKQVARGKPLPPGIAKKQLAPGLIAIAPRLERGYSYARVGHDVVVLNPAGVVVDLLLDAFR
ncbi:MAG: hypothetical protein ABIR59_03995 [Gemmatimonadales bacterium]